MSVILKVALGADFAMPSDREPAAESVVLSSAASAADLGGGRPRTLLAARANSQPLLGPRPSAGRGLLPEPERSASQVTHA